MTAFDTECPRCQKLKRTEKSCSQCGTVNPIDSQVCRKCKHPFQPQMAVPAPPQTAFSTPPLQVAPSPSDQSRTGSTLQNQSPSPITRPLTDEMLACQMCGNTAGEKLTAICRSGTWTTQSRGYMGGMGNDGYGHSIMVGGSTASSSLGQTALANLLLPPRCPSFHPSRVGSILIPIVGFLISLILYSAGPMIATSAALVTSVIWYFVLMSEGRAAALGQARLRFDYPRWERAIQTWNRLFYCSRCDHVYDPQAGKAAPPNAMNTLLFTDLAKQQPYDVMEPSTSGRAALLAFGVGILLVIGIWWTSTSEQRMQQEQLNRAAMVRAPLLAQYQAALPQVNSTIAYAETLASTDSGSDFSRSEKVSELSNDLSELKDHRDIAKQDIDDIGKTGDETGLQDEASQANSEITGMLTSRETVSNVIVELEKPIVLSSPSPSPAFSAAHPAGPTNPEEATGSSDPATGTDPFDNSSNTANTASGPGYAIRTRAGGGEPPDAASLPH